MGSVEIRGGGGGGLVKKRESPDFIYPEVSNSVYESFLWNTL